MVHAFSKTITVEWHDLMEDPNDLPDNPNRVQYAIIRNKETGELGRFFFFDSYDVFHFDPQYRIWKTEQGEGDYYEVLWLGSYGQDYASNEEDFDSYFEVVAWSYGPDNTTPGYNPLTKGELKQ